MLRAVSISFLASLACAQTTWDFTAGNGSPTTLSANVTGGTITAANSTLAYNATSASSGYTGASGGNNAALNCAAGALATATSTYLEFTVTPAAGATLSATALTLGSRSTSTGPTTLSLFTSANSYASAVATATVSANGSWTLASFSALTLTSAVDSPLTFRIYGSGGAGSGSSGNWRADDITLTVTARVPPPTISIQPVAQTVTSGQFASFTVNASGTGSLTYQWRLNGATVTGATSTTLNLGAVTTTVAGNYDVVVSDTFSNHPTSTAAALTVNRIATTVALSNLTATYDGSPHAVTTTTAPAGATVALSYRGSGNTNYAASATAPTSIGSYLVTATVSDAEHQGSTTGTLTISGPSDWTAPAITAAPTAQTVRVGDSATFTSSVSGKPVPSLQWRRDGVAITGATNHAITISAAALTDAGNYDVVATNAMGAATSATALLIVNQRPQTISFDAPASVYAAGTDVKLSATASSGLPVSFTIVSGGASIAGTTLTGLGPSVVVRALQPGDLTTYQAASPVDRTFGFVVGLTAPFLTSHPINQAVNVGATATFSAAAIGTPVPTWQWSKDGVAIVGATSTSLTLSNVSATGAGRYTVTASNSAGTASADAQLFVPAEISPTNAAASALTPVSAPPVLERLTNLSARGYASPGSPVIVGFVVTGSAPKRVLLRATGPALTAFGVTDALANPQLTLLRGSTVIKTNDDWFRDPDAASIRAAAASAGAFSLESTSLDAAVLSFLEPGAYTVQVSASAGTSESGQVLAEVYEVSSK